MLALLPRPSRPATALGPADMHKGVADQLCRLRVTTDTGSGAHGNGARWTIPRRSNASGRGRMVVTWTTLGSGSLLSHHRARSSPGLSDGGHFFDLLAEDVVFDFVITVPDYPRHVVGRDNLMSSPWLRLNVLPRQLLLPARAPLAGDRSVVLDTPPRARSCPPASRTATDTSP